MFKIIDNKFHDFSIFSVMILILCLTEINSLVLLRAISQEAMVGDRNMGDFALIQFEVEDRDSGASKILYQGDASLHVSATTFSLHCD